MNRIYDTIVLGVGGMGSAACWQLSQRGMKVLGLEQFDLVHDRGSSHGESRIIRQAYFEHADYVPLLFRTYELWKSLEDQQKKPLFKPTGLLLSGPPDCETIRGARHSAERHRLTIENLTPKSAGARWPGFHFPSTHEIVFEPAAGTLMVEQCVRAQIDEAIKLGADIRGNVRVVSWSSDYKSVSVKTSEGDYHANKLIVTAGAWSSSCLQDLGVPLNVVRKFVGWFPIQSGNYASNNGVPTFFFDLPGSSNPTGTFYGFPSFDGRTIKVAEHSNGEPVSNPDQIDRNCHPSDLKRLGEFLHQHLPGIGSEPVHHSVCLYTHSPDQHFIVDFHPIWRNVAIACGFSGHGFKFTPVIGEVLADFAQKGSTSHPVSFLSLSRFANQ